MSRDSDSDLQDDHIIKKLIPQARQLLPNQHLLSTPPKFIAYAKQLSTQNHTNKIQPLGKYVEINVETQTKYLLFDYFKNPIYQRFKQLQIFEEETFNFNFVRYPLESMYHRIENPRFVKNDYSNQLIFDSQFQSGNLSKVQKISSTQYNILLQNDINTFGYNQWFFFKVKNTFKTKIKFNILNMYKRKSLYQYGMRLAIFSVNNFKRGIGWQRGGQNISYYTNNIILNTKKYQTLTWTYQFQYDYDEVYFAYNYPYTYTDLNNYLDQLQKKNFQYVKRGIMCTTLTKNRVDYLTITDPKSNNNKKYIVLSARVHPGQTVSSFMMKGIIDYLISEEAYQLRQKYIFRLIPMLNPDGVIIGNYRCSLAGRDLNRRWKKPKKQLYPQIYYFKKIILKIARQKKLQFFCDLHGHSAKKSIFFYGCEHLQNPYASRQFPFILSKLTKNVHFQSCNFKTQRNKNGTARVALYNATNFPRIYTIQSSFCGPINQEYQYTPIDYQKQGKQVCKALNLYHNLKYKNIKKKQIKEHKIKHMQQKKSDKKTKSNKQTSKINHTQIKIIQKQQEISQQHINLLNQLYQSKKLLTVGQNDSSGSDSDPSIDLVEQKYIATKTQQQKKKKHSIATLKLRKSAEKQSNLPDLKQQQKYRNFIFDIKQKKQFKKTQLIKASKSQSSLKRHYISQRMPLIKRSDSIQQKTKRYQTKQIQKQTTSTKQLIDSKTSTNKLQSRQIQSRIQQSIKTHLQRKGRKKNHNESTIIKINDMGPIDHRLLKNRQVEIKLPFTINLIFDKEEYRYSQEDLLDKDFLKKISLAKINRKGKGILQINNQSIDLYKQ